MIRWAKSKYFFVWGERLSVPYSGAEALPQVQNSVMAQGVIPNATTLITSP